MSYGSTIRNAKSAGRTRVACSGQVSALGRRVLHALTQSETGTGLHVRPTATTRGAQRAIGRYHNDTVADFGNSGVIIASLQVQNAILRFGDPIDIRIDLSRNRDRTVFEVGKNQISTSSGSGDISLQV